MNYLRLPFILFSILVIPYISFSQEKLLAKDILLATVNGEPVTLFDILAQTASAEKQLSLTYSGEKLKKERKKIRDAAFQQIIDRKLVYAEFNKKGYKLPKQIIEKMVDKLAADLAEGNRKLLEARARKAGLTMDDLREKARERAATGILINEKCFKHVFITPKKIHDYYNKHKSDFIKKAQLKLQILYLKCNPGDTNMANFAEKLNKELKSADEKTFEEYVKIHSKGPNRESGGNVGWISEDKLRKEFCSLLKGQDKGKVAGPIMTQEGYYFIRISDRKEAESPNFNQIKDKIKDKLSEIAEDNNYKSYIERLKKNALIRIIKNPGEVD